MARFIVRFCVVGLAMQQGGGIRDEDVKVNTPVYFDASEAFPQGQAKGEGDDHYVDQEQNQTSVPQLGKDPAAVPQLVEDAPKEEGPDVKTNKQAVPQEEEIDEDEEQDEQDADEEEDPASKPELGEDAPKEDGLDPNTSNQASPQGEAKTEGDDQDGDQKQSQASVPQLGEDPAGVPQLVEDAPKEEGPDLTANMQAFPQEEEISEDEEQDEQDADEEKDTASVPELGEDAPKEDGLDPNTNNSALPSSNVERSLLFKPSTPPPRSNNPRRRRSSSNNPPRRRRRNNHHSRSRRDWSPSECSGCGKDIFNPNECKDALQIPGCPKAEEDEEYQNGHRRRRCCFGPGHVFRDQPTWERPKCDAIDDKRNSPFRLLPACSHLCGQSDEEDTKEQGAVQCQRRRRECHDAWTHEHRCDDPRDTDTRRRHPWGLYAP